MSKVAFFYATFPRPTETFVRRELRALEKIGFQPDLYSIWKGLEDWEGKSIYCFRLLKLWSLFFWIPYWAWKKPAVFREILTHLWEKPCPNLQNWNETFLGLGFALVEAHEFRKRKYSLLHGVWATMPATAAFALNKLIDVPFSMGAHAYDVFRTGGDWLLKLKFDQASFIRTSSLSTAKRIEDLGVPSSKVKLIRRGLSYWPNRKNFNLINPNRIELLSVGRLVEKKGYNYQLEIAKRLKDKSVPFRLRIVGDGPLKKDLLKEINRMNLSHCVEFLGSLPQKKIRELYLNTDAFLFTGVVAKNGDRDGIPNVIPEAMSAGCLILSSCFAGASEAFIEDVSGFSINPSDPSDWVHLLSGFSQNPSSFIQMRKSTVQHSKEAFNIKRTANSLSDAILNECRK
ncbi:MAG: glycosyltransferase [Opitutae bacterium]|nr:glycosyltransferase [Opitutae bacterium]